MRYLTCNFPLKSVREVANLISCKLQNGEPCSLIRLGDGEGLLLSISGQSTVADFKYLEGHLGSKGVDLKYLLHLKSRLIQSIKGADILGVRDDIVDVRFDPETFRSPNAVFLEKFRKCFRLRKVEKSLDYQGSRRIAFLHKCLGNLNLQDDSQFCSAWVHYAFHNSGELFRILGQQERIGLISCRTHLPEMLKSLFGFSVKACVIPDMFRDISPEKTPADYIERLENVFSQQLVEFPGMLFLIGGGLYGKLYCQLIRSQGGIALDLGSLFDAWVGIPSRPAVYKSMFDRTTNETGAPSNLLLTTDNIDYLLQTEAKLIAKAKGNL